MLISKILNWIYWRAKNLGVLDRLNDENFVKILYWQKTGKKLRLNNPNTYNEKLQWMKLNYRKPQMTLMVDKFNAKQYVANIIGDQYIIPTLGVWNDVDSVDIDKLPAQFVLKTTHDSGGVVICKDRNSFNWDEEKKILKKSISRNYYYQGREWPYKNVKPRVIAEQYMVDESGVELKDYKIFCFDGKAKFVQVDFDRFVSHKRNLYTTDWKYIDATIEFPTDPSVSIAKPINLDEMLSLAEKLSKGWPHLRVDFYSIKGKIYFGELTFFHGSGCEKFAPQSFEDWVSSFLVLPTVNNGGIL